MDSDLNTHPHTNSANIVLLEVTRRYQIANYTIFSQTVMQSQYAKYKNFDLLNVGVKRSYILVFHMAISLLDGCEYIGKK